MSKAIEDFELSCDPLVDFIDGERDASRGKPADYSRSEDYQRGYAYKYAILESKSGVVYAS